MLLLAFDIFESENWLVDIKYIFLTHSLMYLHSSYVSLNYRLLTQLCSQRFFPLVLPFFNFYRIEINTKYNSHDNVSKYVYMTQEARKI
jgi:hypothetical protein